MLWERTCCECSRLEEDSLDLPACKNYGFLIPCILTAKTSGVKNKEIRDGWLVFYLVEILGNKSVNWPLPVLAPPSLCIVALLLRHGSHCQQLAATSLLVSSCSGWRRTNYPLLFQATEKMGLISFVCRWACKPEVYNTEEAFKFICCCCLVLHTSRWLVWVC